MDTYKAALESEKQSTEDALKEADAHALMMQTKAEQLRVAEGEISRLRTDNIRLKEENEDLVSAQRASADIAQDEQDKNKRMDALLLNARTESCELQGKLDGAESLLSERNTTIETLQKYEQFLHYRKQNSLLFGYLLFFLRRQLETEQAMRAVIQKNEEVSKEIIALKRFLF